MSLDDSLTVRIRSDEQQWVKAQKAAAHALAQNTSVVRRTRVGLAERARPPSGLHDRRSWGPHLIAARSWHHRPSNETDWRTCVRDPLSAAAQAAETAAAAAIDAVEVTSAL